MEVSCLGVDVMGKIGSPWSTLIALGVCLLIAVQLYVTWEKTGLALALGFSCGAVSSVAIRATLEIPDRMIARWFKWSKRLLRRR